MNKEQFEKLAQLLYERGYKKYDQQWHYESYVIGKSFHKKDNKWDEDRAAYQILISIYDYGPKHELYDRLPSSMRNSVSLEAHIDMSRTIDERMELRFPFHDDDTIEEMERIAEGFFCAMCLLVPKPRKEKPMFEEDGSKNKV